MLGWRLIFLDVTYIFGFGKFSVLDDRKFRIFSSDLARLSWCLDLAYLQVAEWWWKACQGSQHRE